MKPPLNESRLEVKDAVNDDEMTYDDVLDKIGFGKAQWLILLVGGFMTLTGVAAQQLGGIIAIAAQCEFEMSQSQKGVMMVACVAGLTVSTYFWGYVADAAGRRSVLLYSMFSSNIFQLASMLVTNVWVFNLMNFCAGMSLGGVPAAIFPYLCEFNKLKHHAVVINFANMFVSVVSIYVPATAWLVLSYDWSLEVFDGFTFRPWRLVILSCLLPGLIAAVLLLFLPETPKLLLSHNKEEEAVQVVDWLCRYNTGAAATKFLQKERIKLKPETIAGVNMLSNQTGCGMLVAIWKATKPLFQKPNGVNYIICVVAHFIMFFSSSGMKLWFPEIVNRSSGPTGDSSTVCYILDESFKRQQENGTLQENMVCDDTISTKTYIDNIIVGTAFLIGFFVQGVLLNPVGLKNVLMASLAIAYLSGNLLHFVTNPTMVLILFCLFILMPGLAISNMFGAIVDVVPTYLRGKAVSLSFTLAGIGNILATNLVGVMLEPLCNSLFAILNACLLVCLLLVHLVPI